MNRLARANRVGWYEYVLKRDNDDVLRVLDFEAVGRRRGRPKMTWRRQVEKSKLKKRMPWTDRSGAICTNQQPSQRGGAISNPVCVGRNGFC